MNSNERRSVLAGLYGNALEWYDFMLFASFASLFADQFFPKDIPFLALLATFGVFAIGFFARPLGGAWLGHYADHAGRRKALIVSISIMTITTACVALLPTYQSVGLLSPILFTLLRIAQGVAIGGELPGSATFLVEHAFSKYRGFAGSLILCTAFIGIFAGSLSTTILSSLFTDNYLYRWGWRYAYLLGGLLGIYGIYLRINSTEPKAFLAVKKMADIPAKLVFTRYRKELLLAILFTSVLALSNYILITYATMFLVRTMHFFFRDALFINLIALFILTLLIPICGLLSDMFGRKIVFLSGLFGIFLLIFPVFSLLMMSNWWYALFAEIILAIALAPLNATVPTLLAEMFPTEVRASGSSIGYNIGQAVFGGTLPLVALSLVEFTQNHYAPAWYIFLWAFVVILIMRNLHITYQASIA